MEWKDLVKIKEWSPANNLNIEYKKIKKGLHKISENQYLLLSPYNENFKEAPGGPFVNALLWSCSEGAVRRAYLMEIEQDDGTIIKPPDEIMPEPGRYTYKEILVGLKRLGCKGILEHASYRIAKDGAFIHRSIESEIALYSFRNMDFDDSEEPYAIRWNLVLYR